jgi:MFS family permease
VAARRVRVRHRLVVGAALAFAVIEIAAGLMPTYVTFALMTPLLGLTALTMITAANTFMQLHTEPGMRGRVMALYMMIFIGGTPLGAPLIGWIGEVAGARWTLLGGGLATFAGVSLASVLYLRHHRRLVAAQTPQQPEQLEPAAA